MSIFVIANNVSTTLASPVTIGATSITLSSSANLPTLAAGQMMAITINDAATGLLYEIMYATAISGTTLTVSRAQEGTGAQAWAVGDYAFSTATAGVENSQVQQLQSQSGKYNYATDTGTANAYAGALSPAPAALTPGMTVTLDSIVASNTGPSTLNINGLGALPIQSAGGVALQGGELVAGYGALFQVNEAVTAVNLVYTSGGAMPFAAGTKSEHALILGQSIGLIQTRTDVTSSRNPNQVYTNSGISPIFLTFSAYTTVSCEYGFTINGLTVTDMGQGGGVGIRQAISLIIQPGESYELVLAVGSFVTYKWVEAK